jgi:hypothetical protein
MQNPYTTGQQRMLMQNRQGFQNAEQAMDRDLTRRYGKSSPGVGGSAVQDQIRKDRDNYHSAGAFMQRESNAGRQTSPTGSTDPTGDLYSRAAQNTADLQQKFQDTGMSDMVRDQFEMQKMADPYQREQDKRDIDRSSDSAAYRKQKRKQTGTGAKWSTNYSGTADRM